MNRALLDLLRKLVTCKIIGGKHRPEKQLITSKTKGLAAAEKREFEKEYGELINSGLIIRRQKRTGKGDEWHISLNPSKYGEICDIANKEKGDEIEPGHNSLP